MALSYIEQMLSHLGSKNKWFVNGHNPKVPKEWGWEVEKDFFRIDGTVKPAQREEYRKQFEEDPRARVLLITKLSGTFSEKRWSESNLIL